MTLILFASLISRVAAFALFLWLSKALKTTDRGLLLGATAFTFSYLLIPFTQGLKFVVGLPFFLLWLIGFLRTTNGGDKRWLALELGAGAVALFSEQWILLMIAGMYALTPSIKIATGKASAITIKDSLCASLIALSAAALAGAERLRLAEGVRPLLSLQSHAHREPHPDAIYALYFLFCIAAFTGCVITYRRTKNVFGFTGYAFVIFGFALPILLAIGKHLAIMENIVGILKPISLYWILGFPFWLEIIHDAVRRKRVDTDTSIIMTFGSVACMLPILPLFGIFIPLSPYLEAIAFACIALCSYRIGDTPEEKLFPPAIYGIALIAMGGVWMFQFLEYAQGWERTGVLLLITTAAPLCLIGTKTRPTTAI